MSAPRPFAPQVWLPLFLTLGSLVALILAEALHWGWVGLICGVFYFLGLVYFLIQTIGRFAQKQVRAGVLALGRLVLCVAALLPTLLALIGMMMFGPSEDTFAKGLTIPPELELSQPSPRPKPERNSEDTFQTALLSALDQPPGNDRTITPSLPSLTALAREQEPLLLRYLAASPAWRVYEERGASFATRRWKLGSMWLWTLHGYYTHYKFGDWSDSGHFQSRVTLGLNGKPWVRSPKGATWMDAGASQQSVTLSQGNQLDESYCLIRCGKLLVEIFEQSDGRERRLTRAALGQLEAEFRALLDRGQSDRTLLPADAIRSGEPVLNLYTGMQPGIYEVEAWINPGEAGTVFLKAYEVTQNIPLSKDPLYEKSNERVGWSENPKELFYSNADITIYEGDWGDYYAARFELWFKPDSGKAARKLLERNFKIEGWQQ